MAGATVQKDSNRKGAKSGRNKRKRLGFTIDTTPLVDIAFLLLTFFMFTTQLTQPQAMEMAVPAEPDKQTVVKKSQLLQLLVRDDNRMFYILGDEVPINLQLSDLRALAVSQNLQQENELITALKVSPQANYNRLIEILDELNLAEVEIQQQQNSKRERKFALVPMTEKDRLAIAEL